MIRMIESGDTLMFALISLHQMIAPPYSIAELLRGKISAGCYNTADEFYADLEKKVFKPSTCQSSFFFPISAELVDKKGIARKAGDDVLLKYEYMVGEAMMRIASQSLYWKTELFSDVEGAYEKLLSACWMVERIEDTLYGHVSLVHTEPFTEEEIADLAEKIEMINSVEFAIRIKQWSVLTDEGLLFIYLCDEDGDYSLFNTCDMEECEDEDDEPCMLPPGGKSNCTVTPAPCHLDTSSNFPPEDFTADRRSLKSYKQQDKQKISLSLSRRNASG